METPSHSANTLLDQALRLAEEVEALAIHPSDDGDVQSCMIVNFTYLTKRFLGAVQRLPEPTLQSQARSVTVSGINCIWDAMEARDDIAVLIDDLRNYATGASLHDVMALPVLLIEPQTLNLLRSVRSERHDLSKIIKFCEELNSTYSRGDYIATTLLIRALLNHVPPVFGHGTFNQVVSRAPKSVKRLLEPLEELARPIGDHHSHAMVTHSEPLPTRAQIELFCPSLELLLQEVARAAKSSQ